MTNWQSEVSTYLNALEGDYILNKFSLANSGMVQAVAGGKGPDGDPLAGVRMVANISSAHVPAFCKASAKSEPKPYKNGYDLGKYRIGRPPGELKKRELVDAALPVGGASPKDVYFGAVELNGSGIRFYGDVCLVLKSVDKKTTVLDRNSYDLIRAPLREVIDVEPEPTRDAVRKREAEKLAGTWNKDIGAMAALKVLRLLGQRSRRYTIGQISETLCDDEDYLEVLKIHSFAAKDLQEARLSAAEAAQDALTGDRLFTHSTPRVESLMWRARRTRAETALRDREVRVHVITTSGRTKD
jgi:hypothetical protein